jgi:ribonuclease VapC
MVIDTSALIAILFAEVEKDIFLQAIATDGVRLMSASTHTETSIVFAVRYGWENLPKLDSLIETLDIKIIPFSLEQSTVARAAYLKYGKGRHPARLNMGDCFSYALAITMNEPLLFKGNDFSQTDIQKVF